MLPGFARWRAKKAATEPASHNKRHNDVPPSPSMEASDRLSDEADAFGSALSTLEHELRTPLTTIRSALQVLDRMDMPAEQRRLLQTAARASQHLEMWVGNMTIALRPDAPQPSGNVRPVNLATDIREAAASMHLAAIEKSARLDLDIESELSVLRLCDQRTVHHLLLNVLDSALRFMEGGVLQLCAYVEAGYVATIVIGGTSATWSPDAAPTASRLLQTHSNSAPLRDGGAAVSLLVARELAASLNGDVTVETPLEGSLSFHIRFPAPPMVSKEAEPSAERASAG